VGSVDKPLSAAVVDSRNLDACYVVRDHDGRQLAYVYFEDGPGRQADHLIKTS
jgi:hypothetical protein